MLTNSGYVESLQRGMIAKAYPEYLVNSMTGTVAFAFSAWTASEFKYFSIRSSLVD